MYCPECDVKMAYSPQDALYICPLCGGEGGEETTGAGGNGEGEGEINTTPTPHAVAGDAD